MPKVIARKSPRWKRRQKDEASWRVAVLLRDGVRCRACGMKDGLHAHHLIHKAHCSERYKTDRRNGLTLCGWCHARLHDGRLRIRRDWLPAEVVECLAEQGLTWDNTGPKGPCASYFE